MKIIDRLLLKFGYIKLNDARPKIIDESKFDIQMLRMECDITYAEFINARNPEFQVKVYEEIQLRKFMDQVAPFIEKRVQRTYPLRANALDGYRHELRLFVAKPKSWQL